jgi:hypothetical protein
LAKGSTNKKPDNLNFYDNPNQTSGSMNAGETSSVKMMSEKLEKDRVGDLKIEATLGMKGNLVHKGRCPVCTLRPPCKHYDSPNDLPSVSTVQPSITKHI